MDTASRPAAGWMGMGEWEEKQGLARVPAADAPARMDGEGGGEALLAFWVADLAHLVEENKKIAAKRKN
jgi:hypothetical protein